MTDITTRLLSMSETWWMDRSMEDIDALLLEAKGEIERLRATKPLATNISEISNLCRQVAEEMIAASIQWRLDPRYIIKLCDAADHVGTLNRRVEELQGIGSAHDLISDWLGEGVDDLSDETPVNVRIGARCIIHNKLGELRAALTPQQKGNADGK